MARRTLLLLTLGMGAIVAGCTSSSDGRSEVPAPSVAIVPVNGPGGTWVDVRAEGFPPEDSVELGLGPPRSEYAVVRREETDLDGGVSALMQVPDWADAGERYVFVVSTLHDDPDLRVRGVSEPFTVDEAGSAPAAVATVEGILTGSGVECPSLETDAGTVYTLTGDLSVDRHQREISEGDRIRVFGTPAEMSFCMQGVTLDVDSVEVMGGPG